MRGRIDILRSPAMSLVPQRSRRQPTVIWQPLATKPVATKPAVIHPCDALGRRHTNQARTVPRPDGGRTEEAHLSYTGMPQARHRAATPGAKSA